MIWTLAPFIIAPSLAKSYPPPPLNEILPPPPRPNIMIYLHFSYNYI